MRFADSGGTINRAQIAEPKLVEHLQLAAGPVGLMLRVPIDHDDPIIRALEGGGLVEGRAVERDHAVGPMVLFTITSSGRSVLSSYDASVQQPS